MIRNYFKIALRNLLKRRFFSIVNIFGLAIGIAACILILQYVQFEWSYDHFHKDGDRIFRVLIKRNIASGDALFATTHPGVSAALKNEFPEIEESARIVPQSVFLNDVSVWTYVDENGREKVFNEEKVYCVDQSFLHLFSFPFLSGDFSSALLDPSSIVISETIARKYFGDQDPIGKILLLNNDRRFTVTGVFKNIPDNSHLTFDILVSYFFLEGWAGQWSHAVDWRWPEFTTYVKIAPGVDLKQLEDRFDIMLRKYMGSRMKEMGFVEHLRLQPLFDIHLNSPEMAKVRDYVGSALLVKLLLGMAILVLLIAWINYINLSTSRAVDRAREVGVRKVVGAQKSQLILQFLAESTLIHICAVSVSIAMVMISYPYFIQLSGMGKSTDLLESGLISESWFWLTFAGVFISGSFLAGLYPAFVLSSFKIITVLKGKFSNSRTGVQMRTTLVGIQFCVSVVLIVGTTVIFIQVDFMRKKHLGYDKEQLLVVRSPNVLEFDSTLNYRNETLKIELQRDPSIRAVTISTEIPGKFVNDLLSIRRPASGPESIISALTYTVDVDFLKTYGMKIIAGRDFVSTDHYSIPFEQGNPVILTEVAANAIGFVRAHEAVGREIAIGPNNDFLVVVVGVVKNFHQRSVKDGYNAILFKPSSSLMAEYFTIRMDMQNPAGTIEHIEEAYAKTFPGNEFSYFFLDEFFDAQYVTDKKFQWTFGLFSILSVIVTCLGLFGLSTFTISQRNREIGIRKVFGATTQNIIYLFSFDFLRLILVANFLGLPIAYWLSTWWLQNFSFKTTLNLGIFLLPSALLMAICIGTVSFQVRASTKSPVEALRLD